MIAIQVCVFVVCLLCASAHRGGAHVEYSGLKLNIEVQTAEVLGFSLLLYMLKLIWAEQPGRAA